MFALHFFHRAPLAIFITSHYYIITLVIYYINTSYFQPLLFSSYHTIIIYHYIIIVFTAITIYHTHFITSIHNGHLIHFTVINKLLIFIYYYLLSFIDLLLFSEIQASRRWNYSFASRLLWPHAINGHSLQ